MSVHKKILQKHGVQEAQSQNASMPNAPLIDKEDQMVDKLVQE
jgi:hypothetical protein